MQSLNCCTMINLSFALQIKRNISLMNRDICNSRSAMFFTYLLSSYLLGKIEFCKVLALVSPCTIHLIAVS